MLVSKRRSMSGGKNARARVVLARVNQPSVILIALPRLVSGEGRTCALPYTTSWITPARKVARESMLRTYVR